MELFGFPVKLDATIDVGTVKVEVPCKLKYEEGVIGDPVAFLSVDFDELKRRIDAVHMRHGQPPGRTATTVDVSRADGEVFVGVRIKRDSVWIDPDGVSWYARQCDTEIIMERTEVKRVDAAEVAKRWRGLPDGWRAVNADA